MLTILRPEYFQITVTAENNTEKSKKLLTNQINRYKIRHIEAMRSLSASSETSFRLENAGYLNEYAVKARVSCIFGIKPFLQDTLLIY